MIGIATIISIIAIQLILLLFLRQKWLRAGLFASMILGIISLTFLILAEMRGAEENFVLDSFFILNMLLPILFSIEIHMFFQKAEKRKK